LLNHTGTPSGTGGGTIKYQDEDSKDNNSEYLRRAEDALEASELRYRRLFESAQDGILILDFDTGQILDVNPYLIEMLGYSHANYLGKRLWEIGPFKDVAASKALFRELQEKGYVRYEDLPLETGDGRSIAVEFVSNSYPVNGKTFIQCNIREITERKQAEDLIRVRLSLLECSANHSLEVLLQKTLDEIGSLTNSPIGFYHFMSEDEKILSLQAWSTRTVTEYCKAEGK
jgi:PAS domain S-box-containing protein